MVHKSKEARKKYCAEYYQKHRQRCDARSKKWADEHKDYEKKRQKIWYWENKSEKQGKARNRYSELRMQALELYGGNPPMCKICSEENISKLSIDHINEDGDKDRWMNPQNFILKILKEKDFSRYQVLCIPCNLKKYHRSDLYKERIECRRKNQKKKTQTHCQPSTSKKF